jgi:phytoene desaturase
MTKNNSTFIVGAGISGLVAAAKISSSGFPVTICEKNSQLGGRGRVWENSGFRFDMGPSWYWMPDVIDSVFCSLGRSRHDYYDIVRLDPSYRVFFSANKDNPDKNSLDENSYWDMPASINGVVELFESAEKGSGLKLLKFLNNAQRNYEAGMYDYAQRPSLSIFEFLDLRLIKESIKRKMFSSFGSEINSLFKNQNIRQILEFPILFLGATAKNTPAMYNLMNYADIALGTWYPRGGMSKIFEALTTITKTNNVTIENDTEIVNVAISSNIIKNAYSKNKEFSINNIICAADYYHFENNVLPEDKKSYSKKYWQKKVTAPSSLLFYIGVKGKVENLLHHNLFFDEDFGLHSQEIYETPCWPSSPLFYVCVPSKTDPTVAPANHENLFILIPTAAGIKDSPEIREIYFNYVAEKIRKVSGFNLVSNLVVRRDYAYTDFLTDYNSFRGNAYGLANTISQTAYFKPSIKSKKIDNLYYTGQLTVPGPGIPPCMLSGKIVADIICSKYY